MKRALILIALALAGCGNWSNQDLEYLNALPTKDTLETQLKGTTGQMLRGEGTKQQPLFDENHPLNVGDASSAYSHTKDTANGFNGIIAFVVDIVAFIETVQPTKRTTDSRVWGPYPDSKHPGNEWRVTINKVDMGHFNYAFECHSASTQFTTVISGEAQPTKDLHRGIGTINLFFKLAQDNCSGDPTNGVDSAEIDYNTSTFPTAVEVRADASNDAGTVTIDYSEAKDNVSGTLSFVIDPTTPLYDGGIAEIRATSYWLSDGSGKQVGAVTKGTATGINGIECWDSSQAVTYQKWWDGTEHGDAGSCPAPPF
jgi:hypothetical protein